MPLNALCIVVLLLTPKFVAAELSYCVSNGVLQQQDTVKVRKSFQQNARLQIVRDSLNTNETIFTTTKKDVADTFFRALAVVSDSLKYAKDTVVVRTLGEMPLSNNAITDIIKYKAQDSIAMEPSGKHAFIYKKGSIDYQDLKLKADDISVDFDKQILYAQGAPDSVGTVKGKPIFKQGDTEYHAEKIIYNINTQKGIINGVITQEGEGFLHGNKVKKLNDSIMCLNSGMFTTCNHADPHFAIKFTKSKLITNDKIVTGPAYLSIGDVPTPLVVPFAFFPFTKGRSSGLIIPSYGWANNRGFYLRGGGYYFAINDYIDLLLAGDIYTNLSWALNPKTKFIRLVLLLRKI